MAAAAPATVGSLLCGVGRSSAQHVCCITTTQVGPADSNRQLQLQAHHSLPCHLAGLLAGALGGRVLTAAAAARWRPKCVDVRKRAMGQAAVASSPTASRYRSCRVDTSECAGLPGIGLTRVLRAYLAGPVLCFASGISPTGHTPLQCCMAMNTGWGLIVHTKQRRRCCSRCLSFVLSHRCCTAMYLHAYLSCCCVPSCRCACC